MKTATTKRRVAKTKTSVISSTKEICGITCEIETANGFTDISIDENNEGRGLYREWIVRKAPEAEAVQIAEAVTQHLLRTPKPPENLRGEKLTQEEVNGMPHGDALTEVWRLTPEAMEWQKNQCRVSHEFHEDRGLNEITFWKGFQPLFGLTHKTIA